MLFTEEKHHGCIGNIYRHISFEREPMCGLAPGRSKKEFLFLVSIHDKSHRPITKPACAVKSQDVFWRFFHRRIVACIVSCGSILWSYNLSDEQILCRPRGTCRARWSVCCSQVHGSCPVFCFFRGEPISSQDF